jgi:hypothetical protein
MRAIINYGETKHKSYIVRSRLIPGVGQDQMVQCLMAEGYKIQDIQLEKVTVGDRRFEI